MKNFTLIALFAFFLSNDVFAQETFEMKEGDTTFVMQKYFMCFLSKGDASGYDSTQLATIQADHLAHLNQMAEDGKISVAGPFGDDQNIRGIVIFNVATMEEAIKLQSEDPAVKAGVLEIEIRPWWAAKGSVLK